jgi:hypothetical protein
MNLLISWEQPETAITASIFEMQNKLDALSSVYKISMATAVCGYEGYRISV